MAGGGLFLRHYRNIRGAATLQNAHTSTFSVRHQRYSLRSGGRETIVRRWNWRLLPQWFSAPELLLQKTSQHKTKPGVVNQRGMGVRPNLKPQHQQAESVAVETRRIATLHNNVITYVCLFVCFRSTGSSATPLVKESGPSF